MSNTLYAVSCFIVVVWTTLCHCEGISSSPNLFRHRQLNPRAKDNPPSLNYESTIILDETLSKTDEIYLNIGGILPAEKWINVNAQYDNEFVDNTQEPHYIIRNMDDLHGFTNGSVSVIYSSHALEHTSVITGETQRTLREWRRVLRPGGLLFLSVPDMELLAHLWLRKHYPDSLREMIMAMMFGGQEDAYDYHMSGFDEKMLLGLLKEAGFCASERVQWLNVFPRDFDSSTVTFLFTTPVSLNIITTPCLDVTMDPASVDLLIHMATPYQTRNYEEIPDFDPKTGDFFYYNGQGERVIVYNYYGK